MISGRIIANGRFGILSEIGWTSTRWWISVSRGLGGSRGLGSVDMVTRGAWVRVRKRVGDRDRSSLLDRFGYGLVDRFADRMWDMAGFTVWWRWSRIGRVIW
ncbi:hypothetical protein CTI12_AA097450 [Artemisia annua]|uniref:Uncharacterized protein n=1 Tax=Artemisia annua TaxID=35608 RepID=A0A2U1P766_ARTAN|nr:hypothetical protein CTI12_AA097450 [Artemisia annua]